MIEFNNIIRKNKLTICICCILLFFVMTERAGAIIESYETRHTDNSLPYASFTSVIDAFIYKSYLIYIPLLLYGLYRLYSDQKRLNAIKIISSVIFDILYSFIGFMMVIVSAPVLNSLENITKIRNLTASMFFALLAIVIYFVAKVVSKNENVNIYIALAISIYAISLTLKLLIVNIVDPLLQ